MRPMRNRRICSTGRDNVLRMYAVSLWANKRFSSYHALIASTEFRFSQGKQLVDISLAMARFKPFQPAPF